MHGKDHIRLFGNFLYAHFAATGILQAATTLRLDQDVTFARSGMTVCLRYHHSHVSIMLDEFASDLLAATAHARLQQALQRFVRRRQLAAACRRALTWSALPVVGFLVLLLVILVLRAVTLTPLAPASAASSYGAPTPGANMPMPVAPSMARPDPAALAKALADGAAATRFSVPFSNGPHGTLYVLADPLCPHCRHLEPELDHLAQDYTIHIFPVSIIGGAQSARLISQLLCVPHGQRTALWKKIIAGGSTQQNVCEAGSAALAANDRIFHALQLEGTPTIVDGAGRLVPDIIPNTAAAIGAWMRADAPR